MNISSLSIQSKQRLSELLDDLIDVLDKKDSLMQDADALIEKMAKSVELQNKLDSKSLEFSKLSTSIDAKELKDIVNKSDEISIETEKINNDSKILNKQLEELHDVEVSLMNEINEIMKIDNKKDEFGGGIFVDKLNTNVYIIDAPIPEDKDKLSPLNCEIINCSENLVNEISNSYNNNVNQIITENDNINFNDLKNKVNEYKKEKNDSYDKRLEFLTKNEQVKQEINNIINETPVDENMVQEVLMNNVTEQPIQNEVINNEPKQVIQEGIINSQPEQIKEEIQSDNNETIIEEKTELNTPIEEPIVNYDTSTSNSALDRQVEEYANKENSNNIISIDELINGNQVDNTNVNNTIQTNVTQPDNNNYLYIDKNNILNKMTRATKDKLHNKITKIFEGSYPQTIIMPLQNINDINNNEVVNIDNFLNNKAA